MEGLKISQLSSLKVRSITVKNFRTYYGEKEPIELSVDPKKPVTVIHGISGRGKTSLLNAVHWCIYGFEKKDKNQKQTSSEGLVHSYLIDNLQPGQEENMFVRIIMENENGEIEYEIEREIIVKKISSETSEKWNEVIKAKIPVSITATTGAVFAYKDPDTDELVRISSEDNIKDRLEQIFPEILSSYVLFDAELLRQFESQNEDVLIKKGIETITGLPIVDSAKKHIEKENKKTTSSNVSAKAEFKSLQGEIERFEKEISRRENENKTDQKKIDEKSTEITELTNFLVRHDEDAIKKNELEMKKIREEITFLGESTEQIKEDMKKVIFENLSKYYLRDAFMITNEKFERWTKEGLIPSRFTKEALQGLLDDKECVCERPLGEHDEEYRENIVNAIKKVYEAAVGSEIGKIRGVIEDVIDETGSESSSAFEIEYIKYQTQLAEARTKRATRKSELLKNESLFETDIYDQVGIQTRQRKKLEQEVDSLKNAINSNNVKLNVYKPKLIEKEKEFNKMKKEEIKDEFAKNKIKLSDYAESILGKASEKLLSEFKTDVESATQEYFLEIAPQAKEFSGIKIDDDNFTISALRKNGREKEISQGQAHSLGLSYISGIRTITRKNYFMMIDSPFHNISQESKLLACVDLPTKMGSTQVTFFCTNTEYIGRIEEDDLSEEIDSARHVLKKHGLLGCEYNLVDEVIGEIDGEEYRNTNVVRIS